MVKSLLNIFVLTALLLAQVCVASDKPNILLIVLDDWGWRDAGFMGNTYIETPTLDKLAGEGLVFRNAYSNSPNCAPSRAAIMSGQYAPRTEVYTMMTGDMGDARLRRVLTPPNKTYLEPRVITLAEMLKSAGYRTAHIGKWNLGSGEIRGPEGQGFDVNIAGDRNGTAHHGHFAPYALPGLEQAPPGEYLTDRLTQEAIHFMAQQNGQPFFVHLSHFAPHFPYQAPKDLVEKYRHKSSTTTALNDPVFAAMVERIDSGLHDIMIFLENNHLLDNTLVIVTSDNGGYEGNSYTTPLRGQKSLLYEGGVRVPLLFWWKGQLHPGITDVPAIGIDLYPTLMHIAGVAAVSQPLDGSDLSPLFSRPDAHLDRPLYWYFPGYVAGAYREAADTIFQQRPAAVIRQGEWKLIRYFDSDKRELYNLDQDPGEQRNLAETHPEQTKKLTGQLLQWLTAMKAPLDLPANPDYDKNYEASYVNSWWRKWRMRLSETRFGAFLKEKDL